MPHIHCDICDYIKQITIKQASNYDNPWAIYLFKNVHRLAKFYILCSRLLYCNTILLNINIHKAKIVSRLQLSLFNSFAFLQLWKMTTFVIVYFMKIKSYACLSSPTQSTTETTTTEINSFCAGQKTLLYDMVMCILAWTKGCGYWRGLCPRQGQEVQRGNPCPVLEALSWSSGSLRADRVSWGLETAPGLPPWETTRGHKGLLQWLKFIFLMTMKPPIFTCPSDVFLVFCGMLSSQLIGCARVRLMESPPSKSQPCRSSE